jgi:hypothetical protein
MIKEMALLQLAHLDEDDESKIAKLLKDKHPDAIIYPVKDPNIKQDIMKIEQKHPRGGTKQLKVAIVYSKANQVHPQEMFQNCKLTLMTSS